MSNAPDPFAAPPEQPQQPPQQKSITTVIILVVLAALSIPVLVGLLLPAVQAAREAARRTSCSNNMQQICIAMLNYHAANNSLPPAFTTGAEGQPLHSWRTLLLPYMKQEVLYDSIDLSKPWDDPANQVAFQTVVEIYSCPSMGERSTKTPYVAIVDPTSMMPGATAIQLRDTLDGTSRTILFTETDHSRAVHWMSPQDTDLDSFLTDGDPSRGTSHLGGFHVAMGDGAVVFVDGSLDQGMRKACVTRDGREMMP